LGGHVIFSHVIFIIYCFANGSVSNEDNSKLLIDSNQSDIMSLGEVVLANQNWPNVVKDKKNYMHLGLDKGSRYSTKIAARPSLKRLRRKDEKTVIRYNEKSQKTIIKLNVMKSLIRKQQRGSLRDIDGCVKTVRPVMMVFKAH
jgi:hypothetical protein